MSYSVDVNLLLYSSDQSSFHFEASREFLSRRLAEPGIFYLTWVTAMSYLRMSTHSRIFSVPLSPQEALGNLKSLLSHPSVQTLAEKEHFLSTYTEVSSLFPVRANLVPDAHLAAILLQHGVRTLYTNDADFKKFDFLQTINPLKP